MTSHQEAIRSMIRKLFLTTNEYKKIWTGNQLMVDAVTIVRNKFGIVDKNWLIQQNITTGWGDKKKEVRTSLDDKTFFIYGIIRTLALSKKDDILYANFDTTISKINKILDSDISTVAQHTIDTVDLYKPELEKLGITKEIYEEYVKITQEYNDLMAKPEQTKGKQAKATKIIKQELDEIVGILERELDTIMMMYMVSEPEFFGDYVISRIIYDNRTGHYSLIGLIRDEETNEIISGARVEPKFKAGADLANKVKYSGAKGNYIFKKLEAGEYEVTYFYEGYDPLTITVVIHKGKTTRQDVKLRKKE